MLKNIIEEILPKSILYEIKKENSFVRKLINYLFGWKLKNFGINIHLDTNNNIELNILNGDISDIENLFIFHSILNQEDNILEIGAKSGIYSIFLGKNILKKGKIFAIENNNKLLSIFKKNINKNKLQNIIIFNSLTQALKSLQFHNLKLIHVSSCTDNEYNLIVRFIEENKIKKIIWEINALDNLTEFKQFLDKENMKYRLIRNGRFLDYKLLDKRNGMQAIYGTRQSNITVMGNIHSIEGDIRTQRNGISGFSLIRSASLYPFELCYESILNFVDEFIIAVDTNPPPSPFGSESSNDKLINDFLEKTKHRKKIKIIRFDFKARYYNNYIPIGRWIADVNNRAVEACSYDGCIYVMADEMFFDGTYDKDIIPFIENNDDAIIYDFLHFYQDFHHIRDPRTASYTRAIRVFKKDKFSSYFDGFSFSALKGKM